MSDETGKTKAIIDLAASNQRMRELLQKVAGIAEAALANQPHEDGTCWRALSKAIGELRKALRPEPGTLVFMDEWAWFEKKMEELRAKYGAGCRVPVAGCETPLDPNAPEMVRGGEPDEKKAVGNICKPGKCISYAIDKRFCVTVTAAQEGREDEWSFDGVKDGVTVIHGTILAGRWGANHYCKFIRNGIVSRANRIIKNRAHRKAKAKSLELGAESFVQRPAPLTPEEENGGSDGAQPSQGEGAAA